MVYTVYKGIRIRLGAVAADFHDATQTVNINLTNLRGIFDFNFQSESRAQWVKTRFVALIESPYTTLYQTVCTGHDLSSDEISQTDPIKKGVSNFGEPYNQATNPPGCVLADIKRGFLSSLSD